MAPFIATPAAATIIMVLGSTVTGELSRCTASTAIQERNGDQGRRVNEGGKHAGALVAEGSCMIGRTRLEVDRQKTQQEGQKIRDIMPGLG